MAKQTRQEEWLRDVERRQRNIVFPDTVENEARFWRNIGKQPFTTSTKIALALFAILGWGFLAKILIAYFHEGKLWALAFSFILLWGPVFCAISWATRRALRNIQKAQRGSPSSRHRST